MSGQEELSEVTMSGVLCRWCSRCHSRWCSRRTLRLFLCVTALQVFTVSLLMFTLTSPERAAARGRLNATLPVLNSTPDSVRDMAQLVQDNRNTSSRPSSQLSTRRSTRRPTGSETKTILFWTKHYSSSSWSGMVRALSDCGQWKCRGVVDKSMVNVSDALVFHMWTIRNTPLPQYRSRSQRWVLWGQESPPYTRRVHFNPSDYNGLFNWTLTYRRDSDLWAPYRTFTRHVTSRRATSRRDLAGRRHGGLALISNCGASGRWRLTERLSNLTQIDVFGKCNKRSLRCPESQGGTATCLRRMLKSYRYFLSFENSHCQDYVTEKYWRHALDNNVLPIVYGPTADNYRQLAVPGSYLHVDDFKSVEQLAEYLNMLRRDDESYSAYFDWKKKYTLSSRPYWCELCRKLHVDSAVKVYHRLDNWWNVC